MSGNRASAPRIVFGLVCAALTVACDDGGGGSVGDRPWEGDRAAVISPDGKVTKYDPGSVGECLPGSGENECIDPATRCGEGVASDVIVDADGKLIDIVCYPDAPTLTVEEIEASDGDIAQNESNAVIALGGEDSAVDLEGDLDVDANNVIIYGEGPDVSSMSGDLNVDGNNTIVRGVRIQGDVQVVKNDAIFVFCVIEGNLTITANNTRVSGCDVYGDVKIIGNNTQLLGTRVGGTLQIEGGNTECEGSFSFDDENQDRVIDDTELGEPLSCKSK